MSLAPSTSVVVRCRIRVATAEKARCQVVRKTGYGKLRLEKTYSGSG
jgi:hypothetical protein